MSVNGVSIYGCFLREVTVKADGKRYKADTWYMLKDKKVVKFERK